MLTTGFGNLKDMDVVVIGSSTTALSCIRLVAQVGARVYCACKENGHPTRTRYFRAPPPVASGVWRGQLDETGHTYLEQSEFRQCVLIPATDDSAMWLSDLPSSLTSRFHVSSSSREVLEKLQDKAAFASLLDDLAIPAPYSRPLETLTDLDEVPFEKISALFLKPTNSQSFVSTYNQKAIWIRNKREAIEQWQRVRADGMNMIVQEYIPGDASDHYFIDGFRDGTGAIRAKMARRRYRIYPIDFGNSSYCESIGFDIVRQAWNGLERVLEAVNYRGIFSAEFKHDAVGGEFKILEINTRPWVYIEFAGVCGMNMCDLYIQDAILGHAETIDDYRVGLGCVNLYDDLTAVVELPSERRPKIAALLLCWLKSFKLLFAWRDPMPALIFLYEKVSTRISRRVRIRH